MCDVICAQFGVGSRLKKLAETCRTLPLSCHVRAMLLKASMVYVGLLFFSRSFRVEMEFDSDAHRKGVKGLGFPPRSE